MQPSPVQHQLSAIIATLTKASFTLFIILSLTTPSWRDGPFSWWPLWHFPLLAGAPASVGLFSLLPLMLAAGWLWARWLNRSEPSPWQWGPIGLTLPLLGFTILGFLSLEPDLTRRTFTQGGGLLLFWLIYLFVLNERPSLTLPLIIIMLVQGTIAIGQFALQKDLGLAAWGELPLNPAFEGITVLYARAQPWLRAYGLTAHPNLLGAILAMLLLWLLPLTGHGRGWQQGALLLAISIGLLGLFLSFSRSAWLGFGLGLVTWLWQRKRATAYQPLPGHSRPHWSWLKRTLPLFPLLLLFAFNYDLVLSRFIALDTPIEAQSLTQRLADDRLALRLIRQYPWRGVGLGNYEQAARLYEPEASRVHNVPLYVTAELGLLAAFFWLWLISTPFRLSSTPLAAWVAMIVMNMFDTMVWWSSNWQTAVLFALLVAQTVPTESHN